MCVCLFLLGGRDDYCNVNGCATRRPHGRFFPANCIMIVSVQHFEGTRAREGNEGNVADQRTTHDWRLVSAASLL